MPDGPFISVRPARRSGQPCIGRSSIPVAAIVGQVWAGDSVADVAADYDLSRADVVTAAWYAGLYGLPAENRLGLAPTPLWRRRWGGWADSVHDALWEVSTVDYAAIPDPPSKEETSDAT